MAARLREMAASSPTQVSSPCKPASSAKAARTPRAVARVTFAPEARASRSSRAAASRIASGVRGNRSRSHSCTVCGTANWRSPSSRSSKARSRLSSAAPIPAAVDGAQPACQVGQPDRPACGRGAGREQDRTTRLGKDVQQMQQRLLRCQVRVVNRNAAVTGTARGRRRRPSAQVGTIPPAAPRARAQRARRCVLPHPAPPQSASRPSGHASVRASQANAAALEASCRIECAGNPVRAGRAGRAGAASPSRQARRVQIERACEIRRSQNRHSTPIVAAIGTASITPRKPNAAPPANRAKITQTSGSSTRSPSRRG